MSNFTLDFPISFVKKEERIVVGIATADNIDKTGDVVDFEASIEAFKNWAGNIREMHSPIAVGKAINYEPIKVKGEDGQEYNAIKVEAYISKGAQDTWEKVLDGTLRAFSIGGSIVEKKMDPLRLFRGKPVNIIKKYRLGELSLVDNPANALATVDIIKRDDSGNLEYVLEELISKAGKQPIKDPKGGLTAAGRRHFKQTEGANLKPGVKGPANTPEKMRRKGSFLTRFFTNPSGPMKDEKGRPTRLALSAAAWGEPVPQDRSDAARLAAKGRRLLERYAKIKENKSSKFLEEILEEDNEILEKEMEYFETVDYYDLYKEIDIDEEGLEDVFKSLTQWFNENWVDISRPKPGGGFEPCGRPDAGEGKYPKCIPASKAAKMTQAEIDSAVRRKRKVESSTRRKDKKPNYVSTEVDKAESVNIPTDPELYARVKSEAKRKFRVYPSVYANAWIVREYKSRGGGYRMAKDGEVTTSGMEAGIKNPMQGYPKNKKKKIVKNEQGVNMRKDYTEYTSLNDVLKCTLSNATVFYFAAHRAHWNVEGPDFFEYHKLYKEIYEDVYDSIDSFAENIRKLNDFPPPIGDMEDHSEYEDDSSSSDAKDLSLDLYAKNQTLIEVLKYAFTIANSANEQGIANFIAERIDMHQKWGWQLKASLLSNGVEIPIDEEEDDMEDPEEENDTSENDLKDIMNLLNMAFEGMNKFDSEEDTKLIKMQDALLQNHVQYDTVETMNEQEVSKLSLLKRMVNWLVPDVQENTSTMSIVEESNTTQEDEMDIEVLKDALGAVVDEKLASFATSIKEEVEVAMQEKIDNIAKSFEANTVELQEKLEATEKALAEQEEQVKAFGKSGAVKKSVDPEDDDEEEQIVKSHQASVWNNVYLPQGIINALGYKS